MTAAPPAVASAETAPFEGANEIRLVRIFDPRQRLVYDHGASSKDAKPLFHVTALFRDLGDRTELDMTMTFADAELACHTEGPPPPSIETTGQDLH